MCMLLSDEQITGFQEILEEEFDEKISLSEASKCAYGFLELGLAIYERDAKMVVSLLKGATIQKSRGLVLQLKI